METFTNRLFEVVLAALPVALLYFSGIVYLSEYLSIFGISIHQIVVDLPIVLSYSFNVFSSNTFIITVFYVSILFYTFSLVGLKSNLSRIFLHSIQKKTVHALFVIVTSLILFLFVSHIAHIKAQEKAQEVWLGNAALVTFRTPISKYDFIISNRLARDLEDCIKKDQMRHILTTTVHIFAFCRTKNSQKDKGILFTQERETGRFLELKEVSK